MNLNIPDEHTKLQYASITDAIKIINSYGKCFMAKSDIADAYRLIPTKPECYNLLGFKLQGKYYYDKCLPMGARSSCKIFERFSSSLKFILQKHYKVKHVVKMLDDFLFIAKTEEECSYALDSFIHLCKTCEVPLAPGKTVGPSTRVTFLGIELDAEAGIAAIPQEKISAYAKNLATLTSKETCTVKELKSLIGKLQFTSCVITTGRCFLRRLHDKTIGKTSPQAIVKLDDQTKKDLKIWEVFLKSYNGRTLLSFVHSVNSRSIHMYSDSSKSGYGATCGKRFLCGEFPEAWSQLDIQVLELFPIFLLVQIFGSRLRNTRVIFHCDNIAIVHALNNQTSRNKTVMILLRPLVLTCLRKNIGFRAMHVPGKENDLCDKLSRQQVSPEFLRSNGMDPDPIPVPEQLRPENLKLW